MKKFFSKFILRKKSSYLKLEVDENSVLFNSENINIFKINDINININDYIKEFKESKHKIQELEAKIQELEHKINNLYPFNIKNYIEECLEENNIFISKGKIIVK